METNGYKSCGTQHYRLGGAAFKRNIFQKTISIYNAELVEVIADYKGNIADSND